MQVIDLLINRLESSRGWTCGLLEDIEASDWFFQPAPGVQHVAWQVGHLASSQVTLVHARCFAKTPTDHIPARFKKLFGKGSSPDNDPSLYPAPTEIRHAVARQRFPCGRSLDGQVGELFHQESRLGDSTYQEPALALGPLSPVRSLCFLTNA